MTTATATEPRSKECSACGRDRPIGWFGFRSDRPGKRKSWCRVCCDRARKGLPVEFFEGEPVYDPKVIEARIAAIRAEKIARGERPGQDPPERRHLVRQVAVLPPAPADTPRYRGVVYEPRKQSGKPWRAKIEDGGRRRHLGYFATPEEAGRAYDAAALRLGRLAMLNFREANP